MAPDSAFWLYGGTLGQPQETLGGRQHVAPAPDLDVDGHRVYDGERGLVLLADDAGEHLSIVEVAGQRPLPQRGSEEDSGEDHSGALPLAGVGQDLLLKI